MRKLLLIWAYLTLFFIFYKKSGKFRLSLVAALAAFNFWMLPPQARASETNAFTQPQTQHRVGDSSSSGLFGSQSKSGGKPSPGSGGSSNNDDDDDGIPKFLKNEPVDQTEKRVERMGETVDSLKDSYKKEKKSEQCELDEEFKKDKKYGGFAYKLDKSGNPILRVETKAGSEILLTYDKALEKYYHQDVYNLETPKNFDSKKARSLKPKDRINYLKETVPPNKVIEFQIANAKSLSTENLTTVPGFISARKEPGTLYINKETGQVHFVNARTNIWRTTVIKTRTGLINLAKNNFYLFPNAGK